MKNYFLCSIVFTMLVLFISCKKENGNSLYKGTWELRMSVGGWSGIYHYPAGNGNIYSLDGINFKSYENGQLNSSGVYTIVKDSLNGQLVDRIIFNNPGYGAFISIGNDGQLVLSDGAIDGVSNFYQRIQ